ncbi:MAG: ShlB/FhaC/HecB family hemolysin secretion/activation protein [Nitrospira sp.]|nr:ShlB/FhaC/HecB family hemolysin secretion/activation protein [Nitrospira sp.]
MSRALSFFVLLGLSLSALPGWAAGSGQRGDGGLGKKVAPAKMLLAQAPQAATPARPAETAVPEAPRFNIDRFDVQGNSILSAAAVAAAVAPYTGKSKDFADVQRALEALQQQYQDRGYGTVQVTLPEQELENGVVVLKVIEPRLGKVTVEGNKFFDEANIRNSVPALKEGETPNVIEIGRNSRTANENAAKRTTVLLRAGENEANVDATIRVQDEKFWRASVSLENTGSPSTGMWRLGLGYQHSNLFNRDHTLTMQYLLDPEPFDIDHVDDLKIFGIGYRIPIYPRSASVDLLAGYSSIGAATNIQGLPFNISGSGTIFGARYNIQLPRVAAWADFEHRLSVGLDYKAFSNHRLGIVDPVTGATRPTQPDVTVHPLSITYSGNRNFDAAQLGFYASVAHNIYPHGADASAEKFNSMRTNPDGSPVGARPGAGRPTYTVWRYGVNYIRAFPNDVQIRANLSGQWTRDALITGEQFGLGGWENLRGMRERESSMDRGMRASLEIYSPELGAAANLPNGKLRALAFYDAGYLSQNFRNFTTCDFGACKFSASSIGVGMRLALAQRINMRLDVAQVVDPGLVGSNNDMRVHFGMSVGF